MDTKKLLDTFEGDLNKLVKARSKAIEKGKIKDALDYSRVIKETIYMIRDLKPKPNMKVAVEGQSKPRGSLDVKGIATTVRPSSK